MPATASPADNVSPSKVPSRSSINSAIFKSFITPAMIPK